MTTTMRFIKDIFGVSDSHTFSRDIGIDGRNVFVRESVHVTYIVNPNRITIKLPAFGTPAYDDDSNYLGEIPQYIVTFEPKVSEIAAATAAAKKRYPNSCFSAYINKIIDVGVRSYERYYGTIRN